MRILVLETVNDPGTQGKGGDDRFGFDEASGTAWVLDGATDVTDLRPFPEAESGAAWIAEAISRRLMVRPPEGQTVPAYFTDVLADVRANAISASRIPLDDLPGEARPIASGIWMMADAELAHFAWMGDCMAIAHGAQSTQLLGTAGKAEDETKSAQRLLQLSPEARLERLRAERRGSNAAGTCFGLDPAAVKNLSTHSIAIHPGDEICLMSDGLYRLIEPYGLHDPESFMHALKPAGLAGLIAALRSHEAAPGTGETRIKRRDDACGVYLRIDENG